MKENTIAYLSRHKRFGVIIVAVIILNICLGFELRFTIINLLWILISVVNIK